MWRRGKRAKKKKSFKKTGIGFSVIKYYRKAIIKQSAKNFKWKVLKE